MLVTSRDIITLWVARMVLTGLYNVGEIPFHHVYIHPKILDGFGETMSKTKGNGVDPLDIIDRYGTDALRFGMVQLATETQDSRMPVANVCPHCGELVPVKQEHMYMRTQEARRARSARRTFRPGGPWPTEDPELPTAKQAPTASSWAATSPTRCGTPTRFLLMNLDGYTPGAGEAGGTADRGPLDPVAAGDHHEGRDRGARRLPLQRGGAARSTTSSGRSSATGTSRCPRAGCKDDRRAPRTPAQRVLVGVLDGILRLVQPVMPFVAESLWQALNEAALERGLPTPAKAEESVVIAKWPSYPDAWIDAGVETRFARMQELVRSVREVRNRYQVDDKTRLDVSVKCSPRRWPPTSTRWPRSSARSRGSRTSPPGRTPRSRSRPAASCGRSSRRTCRSPG